ncbi:MAG: family 43 glycosylhydrolase [Clostridia bacterium]|nr:family 43 glycosylhydrolase [Clostridia bacterium]
MKILDFFKRKNKNKWVQEWPVSYKADWKTEDIHLRDPFIIREGDSYYLTGTLTHNSISDGYGTPLYVSKDLLTWEGPTLIVDQAKGFENYSNFWAPEIHKVDNQFWLLVTLEPKGGKRGTYLFVSDKIDGEYSLKARVTPESMYSLDGTLYEEDGQKYIVYCYEWVEAHDGQIRVVKLNDDLSIDLTSDKLLFKASDNIFYSKHGVNLITDGPYIYKDNIILKMLWSTFGIGKGYMLLSASSKGGIVDEWVQDTLVYDKDGGHGMIFETFNGDKKILMHSPNGVTASKWQFEHPLIIPFGEYAEKRQ